MIRSFLHKGIERFFRLGYRSGIQAKRLQLQLARLEHSSGPHDIAAPPGPADPGCIVLSVGVLTFYSQGRAPYKKGKHRGTGRLIPR